MIRVMGFSDLGNLILVMNTVGCRILECLDASLRFSCSGVTVFMILSLEEFSLLLTFGWTGAT